MLSRIDPVALEVVAVGGHPARGLASGAQRSRLGQRRRHRPAASAPVSSAWSRTRARRSRSTTSTMASSTPRRQRREVAVVAAWASVTVIIESTPVRRSPLGGRCVGQRSHRCSAVRLRSLAGILAREAATDAAGCVSMGMPEQLEVVAHGATAMLATWLGLTVGLRRTASRGRTRLRRPCRAPRGLVPVDHRASPDDRSWQSTRWRAGSRSPAPRSCRRPC